MPKTILPIKLEKTEEGITAQSGLLVVGEAIKRYGIEAGFIQKFPRPKSNRGYEAKRYLIPMILSMAGGGRTLEDVQKLFSDTVLSRILKLKAFDASSHCKWLRARGKEFTPIIQRIDTTQVSEALQRSGHTQLTADVDAMMIESEKCTAEKTYKGFRGYNTMLGFFAQTGHCGYQSFRTGNTSPAKGVLTALQGMRSVCPKGTDITRFRSDSAGWTTAVIGYCEDTQITYTITADMNSAVKSAIADIPPSHWHPLLDKQGQPTDRQVAETVYCFEKGHKAHRLIVQRSANHQLDLFSQGRQSFYAISTNADWPPQEVVHFHNGRGQAENFNKELKHSLNLTYLPTNDFHANRFWFAVAVLTYNLFQTLKHSCLPVSWRTKKIATFRWQLIHIPGRLVCHARQVVLKVSAISQDIFDIFQTMRCRLCAP